MINKIEEKYNFHVFGFLENGFPLRNGSPWELSGPNFVHPAQKERSGSVRADRFAPNGQKTKQNERFPGDSVDGNI